MFRRVWNQQTHRSFLSSSPSTNCRPYLWWAASCRLASLPSSSSARAHRNWCGHLPRRMLRACRRGPRRNFAQQPCDLSSDSFQLSSRPSLRFHTSFASVCLLGFVGMASITIPRAFHTTKPYFVVCFTTSMIDFGTLCFVLFCIRQTIREMENKTPSGGQALGYSRYSA